MDSSKFGGVVAMAALAAVAIAVMVYWNNRALGNQIKEMDEKAKASFAELYQHAMHQQQQQQQQHHIQQHTPQPVQYHGPPAPQPQGPQYHAPQPMHAAPPPAETDVMPPAHPPRFGMPHAGSGGGGGGGMGMPESVQAPLPGNTLPAFEPIRDNVRSARR